MDNTSLVAGLALVLSNFAAVPAISKAVESKNYVEACVLTVVFFISSFYHMCQAEFFCILTVSNHQITDHFFVYSALVELLLFFLDVEIVPKMCIFIIIQSILLPAIIKWIHSWALAGALIGGLVIMSLLSIFWYKIPKFDKLDVYSALVLIGVGFFFHIYAGDPGDPKYPPYHSLWHLCAFIAAYFVIAIRDGKGELSKFINSISWID